MSPTVTRRPALSARTSAGARRALIRPAESSGGAVRCWRSSRVRRFQHQQQGAFAHLVAQCHFEFFHHTGVATGYFHGRLVRLHGDQALLGLDRVAGFDQQFDHCHVREVANVGDFDVDECHI